MSSHRPARPAGSPGGARTGVRRSGRTPLLRSAAALLALGVLAACGGSSAGTALSAGSPSPSGSPSVPVSASASGPVGGTASAAPEDAPADAPSATPSPFGSTGVDEQGPDGGGPLSVVAVRVGNHDGYDRVVIELQAKDGVRAEAGWRAEYTDTPTEDGSGAPIEVEGQSALVLSVRGVGYPFDTGVEEYSGPERVAGRGTQVVTEVVMGSVYEGQYQVTIGVQQRSAYRVLQLQDPTRVVVDIATAG